MSEDEKAAAARADVDAAEWFVEIDAGHMTPADTERLDAWLDASPGHQEALGRCDAAMALAARLAADGEVGQWGREIEAPIAQNDE